MTSNERALLILIGAIMSSWLTREFIFTKDERLSFAMSINHLIKMIDQEN